MQFADGLDGVLGGLLYLRAAPPIDPLSSPTIPVADLCLQGASLGVRISLKYDSIHDGMPASGGK